MEEYEKGVEEGTARARPFELCPFLWPMNPSISFCLKELRQSECSFSSRA